MISRSRQPLLTVLVMCLLTAGLVVNMVREEAASQEHTEQVLEGLLDTTLAGLDNLVEREQDLARVMARRSEVVEVTKALLETPREELLTSEAQVRTRELFAHGRLAKGHEGFFLVAPDGTNLASSRDANVGTLNLLGGTGTLESAMQGRVRISPLVPSDVPLLRNGVMHANAPTHFAAAPVVDTDGRVLAVLLLRLNPEKIIEPVLQAARLGESGDVYAMGSDGTMLTASAFSDELVGAGRVDALQREAGNLRILTPDGVPTVMAASLGRGKRGSDGAGYEDYRGVSVVGAWSWYPKLQVGIAVEQDEAESHAAFHRHQLVGLLGGLLGIGMVGALSWVFYNSQGKLNALNQSLERRVADRTAELEQANRVKSDFLARVSHDIRTPMNAVTGLLELARDPSTGSEQQDDYLRRAQGSAQLLLGLLNDVLDLSRIEAGKLPLVEEPFLLDDIFSPLEDLVYARRGRQVDFILDVGPGVPSAVFGDKLRLAQVLTNLVGNAAKFTSEGSITLRVRSDVGDRLRFEVQDTGMGIDPADAQELLTAFRQASSMTAHTHGGSGLGLAICKGLAEAMEGDLALDGEPGVGTTATLRARLPAGQMAPECTAAELPRLDGIRVLVVDDNLVNRMVARGMLELSGAVVTEAADGQQGLERLQEQTPDLVLMDLQMPVLDGFEATLEARRLGYTLPIVAMSAAVLPEDVERSKEVGMDGHLPKPVARDTLIRGVHRYAQTRQKRLRVVSTQGEGIPSSTACAADETRGSSEATAS